jgi:hypothetical protein
MNIKIEKTFKVNDYDFNKNILETEVKLTIQSFEESEIYLSDAPGKIDLVKKQPESVMFVFESRDIPIPNYVTDVIVNGQAEQLAWQFKKVSSCVTAPFSIVCTIEDFSLDEEAIVSIMEITVEMIDAYWDAVSGGSYEP